MVLVSVGISDCGKEVLPNRPGLASDRRSPTLAMPAAAERPPNAISYAAYERAHVVLNAVVNGVPVSMLVDNGASLVALTQ